MCQFIYQSHAYCPHRTLLTSPQTTVLCDLALNFNLRQGIDSAPVSCMPLSHNPTSASQIAWHNLVLTPCPACQPSDLSVEAAYLAPPPSSRSTYSVSNIEAVQRLARDVDRRAYTAAQHIAFFHEPRMQAVLPLLRNAWLRAWLSGQDPHNDRFAALFGNALGEARDWARHLRMYVELGAPRDMFVRGYAFVKEMLVRAAEKIRAFGGLMRLLWEMDEDEQMGLERAAGEFRGWVQGVDEDEEVQGRQQVPAQFAYLKFDDDERLVSSMRHDMEKSRDVVHEHERPAVRVRGASQVNNALCDVTYAAVVHKSPAAHTHSHVLAVPKRALSPSALRSPPPGKKRMLNFKRLSVGIEPYDERYD
ncbi:hypothetical protein BDV95DRAFT_159233 [Massariosphaeria phaeospora]|uniref:Uncharacterized protein n=1 Tax=Massariosphaeria phaeospora TaxID=100035 RepID=A0A7C8I642_9PLEO|nr:hypothetical protein BDV95DRAFT_159233 [Massariosphaeria phaeospora]